VADLSISGGLVLTVSPGEFYARDDTRYAGELRELRQIMERDADGVVPLGPGEGTRGVELVAVIVALGQAGVFSAAVGAFKAWPGRKPSRSLEVDYEIDGRKGHLVIDAINVDSNDLPAEHRPGGRAVDA
jgi:hypothetical protein